MSDQPCELPVPGLGQRVERLRRQAAAATLSGGLKAGLETIAAGLEELQTRAEALERQVQATNDGRRQLAERADRDRLETVLQAAPLPIVVLDPHGRVRMWNRAAEKVFGWSAAEVQGQEPPFVPPEGREDHRLWRERVLRGETLPGRELKPCVNQRGAALDFLLSAAPLHGPDGEVTGLVAMYLDITEQAGLEAQLLRSQRLESVSHLAGGIAHDLNNILSPMMMAAPLLRDEITTPTGRALLASLETSARRGADIVKQILGFARGLHTDRVPVQTRHLLRETAELMQQTFPKSIRVKINLARELWLVEGHGAHLHQVVMNLCLNACDAMPAGGTLTLQAENLVVAEALAAQSPNARPGPHVVWTISDTGTGIAPEHLDRIFEPFFTTKPVGRGSGLGLHAVSGILRNHGGFPQVRSQLGQGTMFKVFLPAVPGAPVPPAARISAPPPRQHECLLVVDDEEDIRILLHTLLERQGYRVLLASSGPEALALLRQTHEIRLIITDLMMPGMDGSQLVHALRKVAPRTKIVINTGVTDERLLAELVPLRVDAVLAKPTATAHLLAALEHALAGGS